MDHHLIQFFTCKNLPEPLEAISAPFGELARKLDAVLPENPMKNAALCKLLEAKDCALRAYLFQKD